MKDRRAATVKNFLMSREIAKRKINSAARVSDNVIVDDRVHDWGAKYAVFDCHIFEILIDGDLSSDPVQNQQGDWECEMTYKLRGRSDAYAATIIICSGKDNGRIYLKQIDWGNQR